MNSICLHASASTPGQWRPWLTALGGSEATCTPALIGYDSTAPWVHGTQVTLAAEVDALAPSFAARSPLLLIGHSYGGAVALDAARRYREQLSGLVLYEPVAFHLLTMERPDHPATREILRLRQITSDAVAEGNLSGSAAAFIDYWLGSDSWNHLPAARQELLAAAMPIVVAEWEAVFSEPSTLDDYRQLDLPVLYLLGDRSPRPTHLVAELLCGVLPQASTQTVAGIGHMGPVTHPDRVIPAVTAFMSQLGAFPVVR